MPRGIILPGRDGLDLCRALPAPSVVPILLLTARSTEAEILRGLELGADDYVIKPFSPRELVARIEAIYGVGYRLMGPDGAPATARQVLAGR
jgi:DNA-binding response OmpR family regulator